MTENHPKSSEWQKWLKTVGYNPVEYEALDQAAEGRGMVHIPDPQAPKDQMKGSHVRYADDFTTTYADGRTTIRRTGSPEGEDELVFDSPEDIHAFQRFLLTPRASGG